MQEEMNLIDFTREFVIKNDTLKRRDDADKTVIITYPKVILNQSNFII